jgi:hypothetical protein
VSEAENAALAEALPLYAEEPTEEMPLPRYSEDVEDSAFAEALPLYGEENMPIPRYSQAAGTSELWQDLFPFPQEVSFVDPQEGTSNLLEHMPFYSAEMDEVTEQAAEDDVTVHPFRTELQTVLSRVEECMTTVMSYRSDSTQETAALKESLSQLQDQIKHIMEYLEQLAARVNARTLL